MWLLPFGYPFFMLKMSLLKNTHLGEKGKESREQEQKRLRNEMRLKNEKVHKSGRVNDDSHEIEAVLSARKNDGKWMYEVKCLGHIGFTWVTFNKLSGGSRG